jgi:alpha 1,2-mannosyltransferase
MGSSATSPRRHGVLHFLLLGSLLYALAVLGYSVLSMHSTPSLPSGHLDTLLNSVRNSFQHLQRTPEQRRADDHALQVEILPPGETAERHFKCIGWKATADCRPDGPRLPELDRPCTKTVPHGQSGFCELQDEDTGELFRVARRTCADVVGKATLFRCLEAPRFANFHAMAHQAVQRALQPGFALPNVENGEFAPLDGIVMVVYPKMVPSAYATVRVLREVLHCRLPIEIWFRPDEMRKVTASIDPLHQLAANDSIGGITFHEIADPLAVEFATKVFAIYHSVFDRVLFLDSDNVPVRDPCFLFETREFVDTGAVFWPDFWHPQHTLFYLGEDSLLWELLDMPFVDMFEQESGQLVIDRRRHAAPLELLHFFTFHRPNPFVQLKLVWGDKDLFRLAWLKLGIPFHMIQAPPAVAGKLVNGSFCGMTMVQHNAQGEVLFLHRNSHKLTGGRIHNPADKALRKERGQESRLDEDKEHEAAASSSSDYPDAAIWTHLLSFRASSPRSQYQIETYHAEPEFSKDQICYGQHYPGANENFYAQEFAGMPFTGLETHLRRFAMEAGQLHQAKVDAIAEAQRLNRKPFRLQQ